VDPVTAELPGHGIATDYAEALLRALGVEVARHGGEPDPHPAHAWARSGAMALTGRADEPPRLVPGPVASAADGALRALRALAPERPLPGDGAALLGERAALADLTRRGGVAPGGSCRLLPAADGWLAVQLARDEDRTSLEAWLETRVGNDVWSALAAELPQRASAPLLERARWLGLPVAPAARTTPPKQWLRFEAAAWASRPTRTPRVLDLSGLWAGPLACALLGDAGAQVMKLESTRRPDGARQGPRAFFDLHNGAKASVAIELDTATGRNALRRLVRASDIVVESARPRALEQLGIFAREECTRSQGLLWVSLTGYGRADPPPGRVAFGDDAAVAAGLAEGVGRIEGRPLFCGDAIADPLAGLHAALAAWALWQRGATGIVDVSLRDVAAHAFHFAPGSTRGARVEGDAESACVVVDGVAVPVALPHARRSSRSAPALGAQTRATLDALAAPC
jgi:hypothetical protein